MSSLLLTGNVDPTSFCVEAAGILQFVGWILLFFRISIPLVIVAFGMFDFGKAVVASKDDEIKKQFKQLMLRIVAGIIIFFIPILVMWIFRVVGNFEDERAAASFDNCQNCILTPHSGCIVN